ncbi:MAG: NAD synthetase [Gemmatimonadetes bacterium]|nr:MAG: NAD synthetase [Gemmatimonadota bacterium]
MTHAIAQLAAVLATALFIFSLHWMNDPKTARRGVIAGVTAMLVAVGATWVQPEIVHHGWIVLAIVAGFIVGVPLSRVPLTAVPQRTALLGFLTFTGSLMATGKLQEVNWIPQRPVTYPGQNFVNIGVLAIAVALGVLVVVQPTAAWSAHAFLTIVGLALLFGVLLIIPIGGADMPTVISILNSYAGLSAVAMGFVLNNKLLVTAGALDGSSGLILSIIMCRAMNRSFTNVLFGAFGTVKAAAVAGEQKEWKEETVEGAAQLLEQARLVVIIPGYGMAVAQAQHRVRELYDQLTKRGVTVKFAIHPVAGRMPGHMNVLLAEADIPYTALVEMDEVNPEMPQCDVALVIGANDVVNPAARYAKDSPIYGMPIIDADKARTVLAIKRSKKPGFAGIDNELYVQDNTWMLFGDAKAVVGDLVKQLAGGSGLH